MPLSSVLLTVTTRRAGTVVPAPGGVMRADDAWTDDQIAILKQMWASGATAAAIASHLGGVSRSAVLGKILRLRAAEPLAVADQTLSALQRRRPDRQEAPSAQPRLKKPSRRGVSLLELTNQTCRFPHGEPGAREFFFCGAPDADLEGGRPYCARHARLAYSSAAVSVEDDDKSVIALRHSPSIAPSVSPRRYVWRAPVKHPAPRWR